MKQSTGNREYSLREGGHLALGVLIGALAVFLFFLLNNHLQNGFTKSEMIELLPGLSTLLVALVSLLVSFHALSEQRLMRQAGTDPVVLVHLGNREDTRALSTLEVSNVGAGAALNVAFKFETDISSFVPKRILSDFSALKAPIRAIPQGSSVSYNFGVGHKLLAKPEIPPIRVKVFYENIDGKKVESIQIIDVQELSQQRADTPVAARAATSLEQMQKALKKLTQHQELHVVTETQSEYDTRKARELKEMQEHLNKQKEKK